MNENEALLLKQCIGFVHRVEVNPDIRRHAPNRRQRLSGLETPACDAFYDLVD
ncbi:hypothetical protein D3C86_2067520 [compost metagenome]